MYENIIFYTCLPFIDLMNFYANNKFAIDEHDLFIIGCTKKSNYLLRVVPGTELILLFIHVIIHQTNVFRCIHTSN